MATTRDLHLDPLNLPSTRFTSSSPATAGLTASSGRFPSIANHHDAPHSASAAQSKFRASLGGPAVGPASSSSASSSSGAAASNNWRAVSPASRASTGADGLGLGGGRAHGLRPASELLSVSHGAHHHPQQQQSGGAGAGANGDTIDRWFEDLQQYEATLEDMAAASLDANFKEELSAIEQWFRVLSEAERTAALYSLLQSATPLQMRFFITILQQMARQDPVSAALLSPANPSQLSFESQMEAKLASFGLKSPASPVVRQFARQSLAASTGAAAAAGPPSSAALDLLAPPDAAAPPSAASAAASSANSPAASTLASQRAKLKASARTSAPANLLLSASGGSASLGESLKSPLWAKDETVRERSPSPRPKSTGSAHADGNSPAPAQQQAPASAAGAYLRSPGLDGGAASSSFDNQLSPLVGGNWASMVNTPLVPMFGKGDQMEQGNYGVASPNLDAAAHAGWNGAPQPTSPNPSSGIVLDDARKFRRSARISGGALGGMYDEASSSSSGAIAAASSALSASTASDRAQSAATAQKRVQDQLHAVQQLKNMQQSAINLGLGALGSSTNGGGGGPPASPGLGGVNGSRLSSTGALSSPGLQQTAMQAQQNWRNANAAHLPPPSPQQQHQQGGQHSHLGHLGQQGHQYQQQHNLQQLQQQQQDLYGMHGGLGAGLAGLGVVGGGSPSPQQIQAQTQAQLASLVALQQQMIQQQQQLQSLASLNGLGIPNAGLGVGMGGLLGPQLSPRLGGGGGGGGGTSPGVGGGFGLGFGGGMPSPRRSPRPHGNDRSPHFGSYGHSSRPGGGSSSAGAGGVGGGSAGGGGGGANPQQTPGSGANPDEPLDMALLGDTPAWLRSLRLHKYTGIFEGSTWQEMAVMGDKDLEDKGVGALGARRKLLKVFETVRAKTGLAAAAGTSSNGSASSPVEGDNHSHSSPNSPASDSLPVTPNMGARSPALDGGDEAHP
ncbi:hypothetical protein JCM9279_004404 [Rhodotorula babjevae]